MVTVERYEAAEKHLKALRSFRRSPAILDAGYDWLSGEIAAIERDLYGHELPNGMNDWQRKMTSGNWSFYQALIKKFTVIVTLFFRKLNRG